MSYTAPTAAASGKTFADLRSLNFDGLVQAAATAAGLTAFQANELRRLAGTPGVLDGPRNLSRSYLAGEPMTSAEATQRALDYATVFTALTEALNELGTLIDANPGTMALTTSPNSGASPVRTFP